MDFWLCSVLFALTYLGLALGRVPGLRMDRAGIAFVGATLMLATGLLTVDQAVAPDSIDYRTLLLLFGMMVVVGFLNLSGFFQKVTAWALSRIRRPHGLLAVTILLSGFLSAVLINDVVCVALTPLIINLARRLRFDPLPHVIALATAANIGSAGTITGNPQNIYIGVHSGIPYLRFAARLVPIVIVGLLLNYLVVAWVYRRRLAAPTAFHDAPKEQQQQPNVPTSRAHLWLQWKSIVVAVSAVILFCIGLPLDLVAIGAAALLLAGRIVNPEKVYRRIDWGLLLMFTGLFIVVHAFRLHVVACWGVERWTWLLQHPADLLTLASVTLSNVVSNVPAVLLLEPVVHAMPASNHETAWLALAMSSTLAGNLTVLGSVANLIVVENAAREGCKISLLEYCKVGVPLTVLTLGVGTAWLMWVHY